MVENFNHLYIEGFNYALNIAEDLIFKVFENNTKNKVIEPLAFAVALKLLQKNFEEGLKRVNWDIDIYDSHYDAMVVLDKLHDEFNSRVNKIKGFSICFSRTLYYFLIRNSLPYKVKLTCTPYCTIGSIFIQLSAYNEQVFYIRLDSRGPYSSGRYFNNSAEASWDILSNLNEQLKFSSL